MKAICIAALGAAFFLSACERLDGGVFTARLAAGEGGRSPPCATACAAIACCR